MTNTDDNPTTETLPNPGGRLQAAREALGLSLQDIQDRLKINRERLAAFEQHSLEPDNNDIYLRGYLRSYCKLLDLPGEQILAEFNALGFFKQPSVQQPLAVNTDTPPKSWQSLLQQHQRNLLIGAIGLVIIGIGSWSISQHPTKNTETAVATTSQISPDAVPFTLDNPVKPEPAS